MSGLLKHFVCGVTLIVAAMCALAAGAAEKTVCGLSVKTDAALSPDGKMAAVIREEPTGDPDPQFDKAGALWLRDCRTGRERRLMPAVAPKGNNRWIDLGSPVFSLDGRILYVSGAPGGDSLIIFRVDPVTGRYVEALYAELLGIITNGPYRGDILATQHTLLYNGKKDKKDQNGYGGYPVYVFDPRGRVLRYIGGSQDWDDKRLRRWLKGQGWQMSWAGQLAP